MIPSTLRPSTGAVIMALLAVSACMGANEVPIGNDCDRGFCDDPPSFTPTFDGGGGGEASVPSRVLACIGTECPAPYTTCMDSPSFLCGTNLSNDPNNCGACGVSCLGFEPINMSASCVLGQCAFECINKTHDQRLHVFKNCNGLLDDGCEVDVSEDPANCGVCGNACDPGQRCINGKCGCSGGRVDCFGFCVDTRFDNTFCGSCDNSCGSWVPSNPCTPMPPRTRYGCGDGECGALKCEHGWMDCNNDTRRGCASDGCEVNVETDPNNCGGCGIACGPGQECRDEGVGPQCLDTCETAGLTECPQGCEDLLTNPYACGSCENSCPNPRANQAPAQCRKGLCEIECLPGFADCNGDPNDGCEVDLRVHPANCGACGNACDFAAGQPCINGVCLMVECDAGAPTR